MKFDIDFVLILGLLFIFSLFTDSASPSDFLLDIDGRSLSTSPRHACVIAYKHGVDIGGKVVCWSGDEDIDEDLYFPEHVRIPRV